MKKISYFDETVNKSVNSKFTIEDFTAFFQVLSNYQYINSQSSLIKNRETVVIHKKEVDFNENDLNFSSDSENYKSNFKKHVDINTIIKINNTSLELTEDKKPQNESLGSSKTLNELVPKVFDQLFISNLLKHIDSTFSNINENNFVLISKFLKLYTFYASNNKVIKFEQNDKYLLDYITENHLPYFFQINKLWIYEEFLNNVHIRRYDAIIAEILTRIENLKDYFELLKVNENWANFISDLPLINEKIIEHVFKVEGAIVELYKSEIYSTKKNNELETILELMRKIYVKLKKKIAYSTSTDKNFNELCDSLLLKFLELTKSHDSHILTASIKFLTNEIYPLQLDEQKIKDFAKNQFRQLTALDLNNSGIEFIRPKFGLYFYLCRLDHDLVVFIPEVYSECNETVKQNLNKHLTFVIKNLDSLSATNLISHCSEKCLKIVLEVINLTKVDDPNLDRLISKIKKFFEKSLSSNEDSTELLCSLSDKLPENSFFNSFIFEKIKKNDINKVDDNLKIFQIINKKMYSSMDTIVTESKDMSDKILSYVLYYIYTNKENANSVIITIVSLLIKYYKLVKSEKVIENVSLFMDSLNILGISLQLFLSIENILLENFKDELKIVLIGKHYKN